MNRGLTQAGWEAQWLWRVHNTIHSGSLLPTAGGCSTVTPPVVPSCNDLSARLASFHCNPSKEQCIRAWVNSSTKC